MNAEDERWLPAGLRGALNMTKYVCMGCMNELLKIRVVYKTKQDTSR